MIEAPRLQNARAGHTSTCLGTKIYVFGGISFHSPKEFHQVYLNRIEVLDGSKAFSMLGQGSWKELKIKEL